MSYYLKYRPRKIAELDLDVVRESLGRVLASGKLNHAYLFVGPRGAGKTSTARILAKVVNCQENENKLQEPCLACDTCNSIENGSCVDVIEIDAASNRGIDAIRELRDKIGLLPVSARKKVYIIDEVHMLTTEAFNALLKTLEEPPDHVIFVLCTTEEHKVPETIISRCVKIRFLKATHEEMFKSLTKVATGENLKVASEALNLLSDSVDGSFREGHKLLEQLSQASTEVTIDDVKALLGLNSATDPKVLAQALINGDTKMALAEIVRGESLGINWQAFTQTLLSLLRDQLRAQFGIGEKKLEASNNRLVLVTDAVNKALVEMKTSVLPSLPLELVSVELGQATPKTPTVAKIVEVAHVAPEVPRVVAKETITPPMAPKIEQPVVKKTTETHDLEPEQNIDIKVGLDTIVSRWNDIIAAVEPKNHGVAGLLHSAKPKAVEGRYLVIEVFYKFHQDQLEQDSKRRCLEEALSETVGPLIVRCTLGQKAAEALKTMPEVNNVVAVDPDKALANAVEEAFGLGIS